MRFLSSIRVVRVALSLAVALWMAGAGCLLGCGNMTAMAAAPEQHSAVDATVVVAGNDSCAAMHGHDCCAKRAATPETEDSADSNERTANPDAAVLEHDGLTTGTMDCPMAVTTTAALSKVQQHDDASVVQISDSARAIFSNANEQVRTLASPLRLPNRGHTYLRCCAFLI